VHWIDVATGRDTWQTYMKKVIMISVLFRGH
jgi:hypothetical protein